jgi:sulfite exporter TauE/SafE
MKLLRNMHWIIGIGVAGAGVALKRHAAPGQIGMFIAGILIATMGLMIIAFGVSRKRRQRMIAESNTATIMQ